MGETPFRIEENRPATPAATVLLLRDGADGLEVFMVQRHLESDFVGGAYVFPGGKVDAADLDMPEGTLTGGPHADTGFRVAAIRETFEECGVLLARKGGRPVEAARVGTDSFVEARLRLNDRSTPWDWRPWLQQERLTLDLDALALWAWWVTPEGVHRRFDTKFYVAVSSAEHEAHHDEIEATDSRWIRPSDALAAARAGEVSIILPTRKNLEHLATFAGASDAFSAARDGAFHRPRIQPVVVRDGAGVVRVTHPTFSQPELP